MLKEDETQANPEENPLVRFATRLIPITRHYEGDKFFTVKDGRKMGTLLLLVLVIVEVSDLVFAVDSIPAIFGITTNPFIVYTSNVFAILGLRAMYFMLAGAMDKFHLLKYGLSVVLVFVGLKMVWLNGLYDGKFPISLSLGVITGVIVLSVLLSLAFPKAQPEAEGRVN
jgi:tellurite resistance protein TerC